MPRISSEESILGMLWGERKVVGGVLFLAIAASAIYTLVIPPVYLAKATILFPPRAPSVLGMSAGGGDTASLASALVGGSSPIKIYAGILESERTLDFVCDTTHLSHKQVKRMRDVMDQTAENTITVSAKSRDQNEAKAVVQAHIDALRDINQRMNGTLSQDDSVILDAAVVKQKTKVADSETRILEFQSKSVTAPQVATLGSGKDTTAIPMLGNWTAQLRQLEVELVGITSSLAGAQSKFQMYAKSPIDLVSDIPQIAGLRNRISELQYGLKVRELTLGPSEPEIVNIKKQIQIAQQNLGREVSSYLQSIRSGMIDPTNAGGGPAENTVPRLIIQKIGKEAEIGALLRLSKLAPGEAIELNRRMRELTTQSAILSQLQGQAEVARLLAQKNPNRWETLDPTYIDDDPTNKSYLRNGAIAVGAGFVIAFVLALWARHRRWVAR